MLCSLSLRGSQIACSWHAPLGWLKRSLAGVGAWRWIAHADPHSARIAGACTAGAARPALRAVSRRAREGRATLPGCKELRAVEGRAIPPGGPRLAQELRAERGHAGQRPARAAVRRLAQPGGHAGRRCQRGLPLGAALTLLAGAVRRGGVPLATRVLLGEARAGARAVVS